jgi:hypothetical protein
VGNAQRGQTNDPLRGNSPAQLAHIGAPPFPFPAGIPHK